MSERYSRAVFVLQNIFKNPDVGDSKNAEVVELKKLGICSSLGILNSSTVCGSIQLCTVVSNSTIKNVKTCGSI